MAEQQNKVARRCYRVTPLQFVETWTLSNSVAEVAEKLGMPQPIVMARASFYRKKGVKLKRMPRHRSKRALDIPFLCGLVEQIRASN
jgi:hypothetical protein